MPIKTGDLVQTNSKLGRYVFEKWQKYPDNSATPYWRMGTLLVNIQNDLGLVIDVSSNDFCMVQFIKSGKTYILKSRWLKRAKK